MAQFNSYTNVSSLNGADEVLVWQSGAVKNAELNDIQDFVSGASRWSEVPSASYTSTPASTTTITVSDTSMFKAGLPVKATQGGTDRYFIIDSVGAGTVTLRGPSLGATAISTLYVGKPEMVQEVFLSLSGAYGAAASTTLLATIEGTAYRWRTGAAALVQASYAHETPDSAGAAMMNVLVNGSRVVADDPSATGEFGTYVDGTLSWNDSTLVDDSTYQIARGQSVELECVYAGTTKDHSNLSVSLTFVLI